MRPVRADQLLRVGAAVGGLLFLASVLEQGEIQPLEGSGLGLESAQLPLAISLASLWLLSLLRRKELAEFGARLLDDGPLSSRDRLRVAGFVGGLCLIGFALRLSHTHVVPFDADEAQLVWVAGSENLASMWRLMTRVSPHPPGYFTLLHGLQAISWHPFWMRAPSVVAGTACIWLAYRLARELAGRPAGLTMAALFALTPPMIELSRIARNYTLPLAFLMLAAFLYARGLRRWSVRDLALAALAAPISVSLHYGFAAGVAGIGLAIGALLALQRASARQWIQLSLLQVPLAVFLAVAYVSHVAVLPAHLEAIHVRIYSAGMEFSAWELHRPLLMTWKYLAPGPAGATLAAMSVTGAILLIHRRNHRALVMCIGPIIAALVFMWAERLPMNGTRHSVFLLPFLATLAAANIPELLRRLRPGSWAAVAAPPALILLASLYAGSCLSHFEAYNQPSPFPRRYLPMAHRLEHQQASFRILEERASPRDIVLLSAAARFQFYTHYELSAILRAGPGQERDLRLVGGTRATGRRLLHHGVPFYDVQMGYFPGPQQVYHAAEIVRKTFRLGRPKRVWVLWGGREFEPTDSFARLCPDLEIDEEVLEASGGLLLQMNARALRACGRALAGQEE